MNAILSYIGCTLSLAKLWVMGSGHIRTAFWLSMISDPIWGIVAVRSDLPGQLILAIISFGLNIRGLYKLHQQPQDAAKEST